LLEAVSKYQQIGDCECLSSNARHTLWSLLPLLPVAQAVPVRVSVMRRELMLEMIKPFRTFGCRAWAGQGLSAWLSGNRPFPAGRDANHLALEV